MRIFQFPKSRHTRRFKPKQYKHYGTYKRWLQAEFRRVCVYCRQPDSVAGRNLIFTADHYRPKGLPRFAHLVSDYSNLYYCCPTCNSFKNDFWPTDERKGPYVVNPCDHAMFDHIRFNAETGKHDPRSDFGVLTEALLHLNDPVSIEYRLDALATVKALESVIDKLLAERKEIEQDFNDGVLSAHEYAQQLADNGKQLARNESARLAQTGESIHVLEQALPKSG